MINFIKINENGEKVCSPVSSREEFMSIRRGAENLVKACREGNKDAKMRLPQINYTGHYAAGQLLKGCKTLSDRFVTDIDDKAEAERVADLLKGREEEFSVGLIEWSVNGGLHIVAKRGRGEGIEEAQKRLSEALGGIEYDTVVHDPTRVIFTTGREDLLYLSDALFAPDEHPEELPVGGQRKDSPAAAAVRPTEGDGENSLAEAQEKVWPAEYDGFAYTAIIAKWWELHYAGKTPTEGNRDTRTNELAFHLRALCDYQRDWLDSIIPCYDGFTEEEKLKCIDSALAQPHTQITKMMRDVLDALKAEAASHPDEEEKQQESWQRLPPLPLGVRDSLKGVEPKARMAALLAIAPAIGALATKVSLAVHGEVRKLNLLTLVVGKAASGKGKLDDIINTWMADLKEKAQEYYEKEKALRRKQRARRKDAEGEEQPCYPVRLLPLNNTLANAVERLENAGGEHCFSFTSELDTVSKAWGNRTVSDFSDLLRNAYDNASYAKETLTAEGANAHIDEVLWNMTAAGTPDALYRFITNYTDGLQTRFCIGKMPDNTFEPLSDKVYKLEREDKHHIAQVARILQYMRGELHLNKLENRSKEWLEKIRLEALKDDDEVRANQRQRVCVNAMRIIAGIMLCDVAEQLLKQNNNDYKAVLQLLEKDADLTARMMQQTQTKKYLNLFDLVADELLDNNLYYFRAKIEAATKVSSAFTTRRKGKNYTVYERLGNVFTREELAQAATAVKGSVSQNTVRKMLQNWTNQGLIVPTAEGSGNYAKRGV